ncbi:MAG: hypothetical protein JNL58_32970 [Planctomyces sp.]|nr:hypothetical protein [Planctomyces sp.]
MAFSVVSARSLHRDESVNALYGDGSVRLIAKDVDLTVWRSQSTIADDD